MVLAIGMFVSCSNSKKEVRELTQLGNEPPEQMDTVRMTLYQKGDIVAILTAPEIERSQFPSKTVFPSGLTVIHYDSLMHPEAKLKAKRGIYRESDQKFEVFQDVVLQNFLENQILLTEYLMWERFPNDSSSVHTNEMVRIFDGENIHQSKEGIITDEKFSWYQSKGYSNIIEGNIDSLLNK